MLLPKLIHKKTVSDRALARTMAADSAGMRARLPSTAASSARVHLAPPPPRIVSSSHPAALFSPHTVAACQGLHKSKATFGSCALP